MQLQIENGSAFKIEKLLVQKQFLNWSTYFM